MLPQPRTFARSPRFRRVFLLMILTLSVAAIYACDQTESASPAAPGLSPPIQSPSQDLGPLAWGYVNPSTIGVNMGGYDDRHPAGPPLMRALRWGNFGWVRLGFEWNVFQPNGPSDWNVGTGNGTIQPLNDAFANQMQVLGVISYAPGWANGGQVHSYEPTDDHLTDWKNYVGRIVQNYDSKVSAWSIWNEPDAKVFFTLQGESGSDAAWQRAWERAQHYARLVAIASDTIRKISSKPIVVGEMSWGASEKADPVALPMGQDPGSRNTRDKYNRDWLDSVLTALRRAAPNDAAYPDVVSMHFYNTGPGILDIIDTLFPRLWTNNPSLPQRDVWLTEFAATEATDLATIDRNQADIIQYVFQQLNNPSRYNRLWKKAFAFQSHGADALGWSLISGWPANGELPFSDSLSLIPRLAVYRVKWLTMSPQQPLVTYSGLSRTAGWTTASDGGVMGTTGQSDPLIAWRAWLAPFLTEQVLGRRLSIRYNTHFGYHGWVWDESFQTPAGPVYADGAVVGPFYFDPNNPMEPTPFQAVQIRIVDVPHQATFNNSSGVAVRDSLCYESHVATLGWQGRWASNPDATVCDDEISGTTGLGLPMQALRVWFTSKRSP